MTHELWASLNAHIFAFLRSVTLANLVAEQRKEAGEVAVIKDHRNASRTPEITTV
jgi:DNA-binding IscR family transcriptional regulator